MNVLRNLVEDRFNDIIISVDNIYLKDPCEIQVTGIAMISRIKKTSMLNTLPIRCVLCKDGQTIKLANVQRMVTSVPRDMYLDLNGDVIYSSNRNRNREFKITFYKELTDEQINELMLLSNKITIRGI